MRVMEVVILGYEDIQDKTDLVNPPLLGIRIRMFLGLPDPELLVRGTTDHDRYIHQAKIVGKTFISPIS